MFRVIVKSIIWIFFSSKNTNHLFFEFGEPKPWYPRLCFLQTTQHISVCALVFGFLHRRFYEAFLIGFKRTWHKYNLLCYKWHILWGWSRWTGPLCCGAFYQLFWWHNCIRRKDNRIIKNTNLIIDHTNFTWSRNQKLVLLMELTWNPIWTCQTLLGHFDCPPRKTLQKQTPFGHTTELMHAAHWKSFEGNKSALLCPDMVINKYAYNYKRLIF